MKKIILPVLGLLFCLSALAQDQQPLAGYYKKKLLDGLSAKTSSPAQRTGALNKPGVYLVSVGSDTGWVHLYRNDYAYDVNWNLARLVRSNMFGDPILRISYSYDAQNRVIGSISENYTNGQWTAFERTAAEYDPETGEPILNEGFSLSGSEWVRSYGLKVTRTTNPASGMETYIEEYWSHELQIWINENKFVLLKDASGKSLYTEYYSWLQDEWQKNTKLEYGYRSNGELDVVHRFANTANEWDLIERDTLFSWHDYSLNQYDTLVKQAYIIDSWIDFRRQTVDYSSHGSSTTYTDVKADTQWLPESKYVNIYDAHGRATESALWNASNNDWVLALQYVYINTYDEHGRALEVITESYTGFPIKGRMKEEYRNYPLYAGVGQKANGVLNTYPNPAGNTLYITAENERNMKVGIYSLEGKLLIEHEELSGNQLDVSALPAGIYLVKAQTGKGVCVAKFIKN